MYGNGWYMDNQDNIRPLPRQGTPEGVVKIYHTHAEALCAYEARQRRRDGYGPEYDDDLGVW